MANPVMHSQTLTHMKQKSLSSIAASNQPTLFSFEMLDLNNLTKDTPVATLINSPRSMDAFNRSGIQPHELDPIDLAEVEKRAMARNNGEKMSKDVLNLRLEHADRQRFKLLHILRETRRDMIENEIKRKMANKTLPRSIRGPLNPTGSASHTFMKVH
jgi:hypothetical protein